MVVKRKAKPKRQSPEHDIQTAFFQWLELFHPKPRKVSFAIPNGLRCSKSQAAKAVAEGLTASIPDVFISMCRHGYAGFYIEFKAKGRKASEEQLIKHELLRGEGYKVEVIDNIDDAIKEATNYLYEGEHDVRPNNSNLLRSIL